MEAESLLIKIGLSCNEAKIYLALLKLGPSRKQNRRRNRAQQNTYLWSSEETPRKRQSILHYSGRKEIFSSNKPQKTAWRHSTTRTRPQKDSSLTSKSSKDSRRYPHRSVQGERGIKINLARLFKGTARNFHPWFYWIGCKSAHVFLSTISEEKKQARYQKKNSRWFHNEKITPFTREIDRI